MQPFSGPDCKNILAFPNTVFKLILDLKKRENKSGRSAKELDALRMLDYDVKFPPTTGHHSASGPLLAKAQLELSNVR